LTATSVIIKFTHTKNQYSDYEEEDEFCPHCDNQYVIEARTPEARLKLDTGDTRIDSR
jgi:hypothetical protein